ASQPPTLSLQSHSITARESIDFSVPVRWFGQRGAAVKAAEAEVVAVTRDSDSARVAARKDVRVRWLALAVAERRRTIAQDRSDRARRNRDAVNELEHAGRVARLDTVRAEGDLAVAAGERDGAELERR